MSEKILYWSSVVFSGLALVILLVVVVLVSGNRNRQEQLAGRQIEINESTNLSQLNQGLVEALADASVKNDDTKISELLASQGIKFKKNDDADAKKKNEEK